MECCQPRNYSEMTKNELGERLDKLAGMLPANWLLERDKVVSWLGADQVDGRLPVNVLVNHVSCVRLVMDDGIVPVDPDSEISK